MIKATHRILGAMRRLRDRGAAPSEMQISDRDADELGFVGFGTLFGVAIKGSGEKTVVRGVAREPVYGGRRWLSEEAA